MKHNYGLFLLMFIFPGTSTVPVIDRYSKTIVKTKLIDHVAWLSLSMT